MGSPIRRSMDQSLFPAPHGLTQGITSFIASCCLGIHQTPFSRLIWPGKSKAAGSSATPFRRQKSYTYPCVQRTRPKAQSPHTVSVLDLEQYHLPESNSQASPYSGRQTILMFLTLNDVNPSSRTSKRSTTACWCDCSVTGNGGSRRTWTSDLTLIRRAL